MHNGPFCNGDAYFHPGACEAPLWAGDLRSACGGIAMTVQEFQAGCGICGPNRRMGGSTVHLTHPNPPYCSPGLWVEQWEATQHAKLYRTGVAEHHPAVPPAHAHPPPRPPACSARAVPPPSLRQSLAGPGATPPQTPPRSRAPNAPYPGSRCCRRRRRRLAHSALPGVV